MSSNRNRHADQVTLKILPKKLWKFLEKLIIIKLIDIRLIKIIFNRIFVETDPKSGELTANKISNSNLFSC